MTFPRRSLFTFVAALAFATTAMANADRGTRDEAKAMVEAAAAHVTKAGAEKAFADFSGADKARWISKDLYVFAFDMEGKTVAHGVNEKLIGRNLANLKDQNGKEFIKEFLSVAQGKGEGWVDYDWANPTTKKVEDKSSFVKRVPGTNFLVGVGIYR